MMRIVAALTAAAVLAASMPSAGAEDANLKLTRYIEELNAHMPPNLDAAAVAQLFAEDGEHHDMFRWPPPKAQRGRAEIKGFFDGFDDRWADYKHVERHRVVNGNHAVWEGTGEGTWAATGKHVEFPMAMSLEFDDAGKVVSARVYLDPARIAGQAC